MSTAYQLFQLPFQANIDSSVRVVPSAKAHFYVTGTTTPQDTYADAGLTTPNANPVVADANGVLAPIYLNPALIYKLTLTTSADVLIRTVDPVNDQILSQIILGTFLYPQTAAENAASVIPTNYAVDNRPELRLSRYGAMLDNTTNDYAAWTKAIAVASALGSACIVVDGASAIASASLGTTGLALPNNLTVRFTGRTCGITITGSSACNLFVGTNAKGFRIHGGYITGHSQGTGLTDGQCVRFLQDTSAVAIGGDVEISNCRISNFKGDYWCYFLNTSATYAMSDIRVHHNHFVSVSGNSRVPGSIGAGAYCVVFQGASANTVGLVTDYHVHHNVADCDFIKGFGVNWQGTLRGQWDHNIVNRAGQTGAADDCAGYAFFAYDNSGGTGALPDYITFDNNICNTPRSCGLYVASGGHIFANAFTVVGQSDQVDTLLPKAAVAINGATLAVVTNTTAIDCYGGDTLYPFTAIDELISRGCTVRSNVNNAFGVRVRNAALAGKGKYIEVSGANVVTTGTSTRGIWAQGTSALGLGRVIITNNNASGTFSCIEVSSISGTLDLQYLKISGNTVVGNSSASGVAVQNLTDSETRFHLGANTYTGSWATGAILCNLDATTGITIDEQEFEDGTGLTTGFCISTTSTQGSFKRPVFNGVAAARRFRTTGSEELGVDAPTWTPASTNGVNVENMNPADTTDPGGAAAIIAGYNYTGAWRAQYSRY